MDEIVVFHPLEEPELSAIAERLLRELEARAAESGYRLSHTQELPRMLASQAKSPYGARELRRRVSWAVEQALADKIACGEAMPGSTFVAEVRQDQVVLQPAASGDTAGASPVLVQ